MLSRNVQIALIAFGAGVAISSPKLARADVRPHAGMLRYPDVSATQIVFVYANDIWIVPREGGLATPLASPPGQELFPKFSPDGKAIAFVGNYDGNKDLYTLPVAGGVPFRVTHHPDPETLCDWTPDGTQLIFYYAGVSGLRRQNQLFTVAATGGMALKMPVPYGADAEISPDGEWLAYLPHTTDARTWKRYRGGMATDVWLFNLKTHASKKITDWEGTDTFPMWQGKTVYYLSDGGPEHRLNIWSYDTTNAQRRQITTFADYDVKWPSIGPGPAGKGEIVFQKGADLLLLDLAGGQSKTVSVLIPGDRPRLRPQRAEVSKQVAGGGISPSGKRAALEMRGDIWTAPAEKGSARNLTRSNGTAERDPAWSPDGKWIGYFSDATGEYELYVAGAEGKDAPRQLTHLGKGFRYNPTWSPDSKQIAFTDKAGGIFVCRVETGDTKQIDREEWSNQPRLRWSHDSNWLTYEKNGPNQLGQIWLYDLAAGKPHQVTSGMFNDGSPAFDRKGDFLYYTSRRAFDGPIYEDIGTTFVYADTGVLLAVPLRKDVASPLLPKSDEEESAASQPSSQPASQASSQPATSSAAASASKPASQPAEKKPLVIDLGGFERRAIQFPVKKGTFSSLDVNHEGKLLYVRRVGRRGGEGEPSIKLFDPADEKHEEKTVVAEAGAFDLSADGKKLLVFKGGTLAIVSAAPDQKLDKPLKLAGLAENIDPRAEWKQIFTDAWRIQRDYFYDPNMHHVDWNAVREQYGKMLDDCASRDDLTYVIMEMISELNVGHTYYRIPESEDMPSVSVGMLGANLELANGAYRIARLLEGGPWDSDARGPLSQPGVKVHAGDYLLAVNRVPIDPSKDPWAAFQGLAGKVVTLTVNAKPTADADARDVLVELLPSEADLRYRDWVEHNRQFVATKTDGKVGYIYVPNTGVEGQNELFRQFYGQIDRAALIIDERWNGGGQIPTRFIELLNRPVTNYWARRDGRDWTWPPDSHQGPKCMLINGLAGSGGDAFPAYFRQAKLGKLIGSRTWGGLVGISGNPAFIDGTAETVPTFGYYKTNGTWGIEGHGVDPDMPVVDDPAKMVDGGDPQLDAAIQQMLTELREHPYTPPPRPAYPDRHGMGIPEGDR